MMRTGRPEGGEVVLMPDRQRIIEEIFNIRGGLIERIAAIRRSLFNVRELLEVKEMEKWVLSRLRDENGDAEWEYDAYGGRVLVVKLQDPWTEDKNKRERKTAFAIYFSFQTSKPIVPAQLQYKLNTIYKVVKKLREKGYHVFPALVAFAATPGAKEILKKHKVEFFNDLDGLLSWIYSKLVFRLQKLVEVAKFTLRLDKVFIFIKRIIEGLGFEVPLDILEAWALKPKYPQA